MNRDTGGPAFPAPSMERDDGGYGESPRWVPKWGSLEGMTLRDYFAAKAMQGYIARSDWFPKDEERLEELGFDGLIAAYSYEAADAMLKARSK